MRKPATSLRFAGVALATTVLSPLALSSFSAPALAQDAERPVTAERLVNSEAESQNWLTNHGNYESHRWANLTQIDTGNVKDLRLAFTYSLGGLEGAGSWGHAALEGTPIVNDGFMYVTNGWGEVIKLDVRDGHAKRVWKMDPETDKDFAAAVTCCDIVNRGVGLWNDQVISITLDGRMIATNAATGEQTWEMTLADPEKGETLTGAPLVVKDVAVTGVSGAEYGIRGWLAAVNLTTGQEAWRTYTIPAPGEPGSETWQDDHNAWKNGGASAWETGSYDPDLNLVYWGTGNPGPDFDPEYRPGDNLFTDSVLALNPDDGSMKWYFQYTPNDPHDHDEISEHPLIDVTVNGETRKLVTHAARNGIYYQFDRATGEFVQGVPYVDKLTWTSGLDPKTGKPVEYDPTQAVQTFVAETTGLRGKPPTAEVCPTTMGGKNWMPTAYNPTLQRLYVPAVESCGFIGALEQDKPIAEGGQWKDGTFFVGAGDISVTHISGSISVLDVTTGQRVNKVNLQYAQWGGMLATAGGLVFSTTVDGWMQAYDANTMDVLWTFPFGTGVNAPPMSYAIGDKQYVAILVGELQSAPWRGIADAQVGLEPASMLYVFSL